MTSNLPFTRSQSQFTRSSSLVTVPARRYDGFTAALHHARTDRLDSWKEIALFLNRTVRTIQRWERTEGLPVHRHLHAKSSSVYAYMEEVVAWQSSRSPESPVKKGPE